MGFDELRRFSPTAVFIDDGFVKANLALVQDEHWALLRRQQDNEIWKQVKSRCFDSFERPVDLKRDDLAIQKAWGLYESDPIRWSILDPIFQHVMESQRIDIRPLIPLIEFLRDEVHLDVRCHPDIESAIDDVESCKLVFLDFYLYQTQTEKILEDIKKYDGLFGRPVETGENREARFVLLMSTDLPAIEVLEGFRKVTKMKSAFFRPVSKKHLTRSWLEGCLEEFLPRYADLQKLANYLDTFAHQIGKASDDLRGEIESIEIEDLTILNSMRLEKDSEHLGDYLSWLMSQALAAKIRRSDRLLRVSDQVGEIQRRPFQGMLTPKTVLFDLYSEVLFSPTPSTSEARKIKFGDVCTPVKVSKVPAPQISPPPPTCLRSIVSKFAKFLLNAVGEKDPQLPEAIIPQVLDALPHQDCILVIAPACDLQRCKPGDDILCVRGKMLQRSPDLSDLLSQSSLFGTSEDGFKHLLRHVEREKVSFIPIEWSPKDTTTIKAALLQNAENFQVQTNLNEIFAQEVKEEALRHLGRIGVPVDPSFSGTLCASVRLSGKKRTEEFVVEEHEFIAGIFVSANDNNKARISLSVQFLERLAEYVNRIQDVLNQNTRKLLADLQGSLGQSLQLEADNSKEFPGGLCIRFVDGFKRGSFSKQNEIVFYPKGRITDV